MFVFFLFICPSHLSFFVLFVSIIYLSVLSLSIVRLIRLSVSSVFSFLFVHLGCLSCGFEYLTTKHGFTPDLDVYILV